MRKVLLILAVLSVLALNSCVDKAYDLRHISHEELTVGGDLPIPLAKIDVPLTDLFDFSAITSLSATSSVSVVIPSAFENTLNINPGFDLAQYIGEKGETILKGNITSPLPIPVVISVSLKKGDTETIPFIVNQNVKAGPNVTTEITPITLTKEQIDFLDETTALELSFVTADGGQHIVDLDPQQSFKIFLSLLKKGGIKI